MSLYSIYMYMKYLPNAGLMYINVRLTGFTCTWNIYLMQDKCTYIYALHGFLYTEYIFLMQDKCTFMYALQDSYVQDVPI